MPKAGSETYRTSDLVNPLGGWQHSQAQTVSGGQVGHLPPQSWMVNLHFPQREVGILSPLAGAEQRGFLLSYPPGSLLALLLPLSSGCRPKVQVCQVPRCYRLR